MTDAALEPTLKPCPFCGNAAHFATDDIPRRRRGDPDGPPNDVRCGECGAAITGGIFETLAAAWNRRVAGPPAGPSAQPTPSEAAPLYRICDDSGLVGSTSQLWDAVSIAKHRLSDAVGKVRIEAVTLVASFSGGTAGSTP